LSGDEDDDEVVLGGPTAGAKRSPDGGAAATAKMATRAKARATNRTIAPVMQADEGENPKTPPKSGFPFATFVEDVRSGDEDEDEFVFEGPATKAKGGRARNTIATRGRTADDPAPPKMSTKSGLTNEFVLDGAVGGGKRPSVLGAAASHSKEGFATAARDARGCSVESADKSDRRASFPGGEVGGYPQVAYHRANHPQVSGAPFAVWFDQPHDETETRGSAGDFLDGRVNERGAYNPPPALASNHRANDPQVSEAPFAALFAQKL
jgi:hypothetical protein